MNPENPVILIAALMVGALLVAVGLSKLRSIYVYLLVTFFLIGPRIPLGQINAMQRADLRLDDMVILIMTFCGVVLLITGRAKIAFPRHMTFFSLFLVVVSLSTLFGSLFLPLSHSTRLVFYVRLIEFGALAFVLPVFLTNPRTLPRLLKLFVVLVAANLLWLAFQFVTGTKGPLIEFTRVASYGYALIAEPQPMCAGGIYTFSFIVLIVYFMLVKRHTVILLLALGCLTGLVYTLSRTNIAGMIVATGSFFFVMYLSRRQLPVYVLLLGIGVAITGVIIVALSLSYLEGLSLPSRRLRAEEIDTAMFSVRVSGIWTPLLRRGLEQPILGWGTGSVGGLLLGFVDEAHNQYLRVFITSGAVGLTFFLLFLGSFTVISWRIYRNSDETNVRYAGLVAFLWAIATATMCMGQDALINTKIAIPLYFMVGLINHFVVVQRSHATVPQSRPSLSLPPPRSITEAPPHGAQSHSIH